MDGEMDKQKHSKLNRKIDRQISELRKKKKDVIYSKGIIKNDKNYLSFNSVF